MPKLASSNTPGKALVDHRAEQLYVTHCRREDSVLGQEGFGVRAASSADPALLHFALEVPAYELPTDMWRQSLTAARAPRRLQRVALADGRIALVHSTYLAQDTCGRERSYFTHVLVYQQLGAEEALRSWAASPWRTDYGGGAPKVIPQFNGVPEGWAIRDEALAAYLKQTEAEPAAFADFLERVPSTSQRRRDWLRWTLTAYLRSLSEPDGGRTSVYLRAEPALVALLLYGVARLLPDALRSQLTFSTYECPGESLREQRSARVVGTWTAGSQPWTDAEYLRRRGYLLDVRQDPASNELWGHISPGVDRLVALAGVGDWAAVAEIHALWARRAASSPEGLCEVALLQAPLRHLRTGPPALAEVVELSQHRLGRELLEEMKREVWPLIWEHCLSDEQARDHFANLLRSYRTELEDRLAATVITRGGPPWPKQGALLRAVLGPDQFLASFRRVLDAVRRQCAWPSLPFGDRLTLLRVWHVTEPGLAVLPENHAALLDNIKTGELTRLVEAGLPIQWAGQAICRLLSEPRRVPKVIGLLKIAEPGLASGFCAAVALLHHAKGDVFLAPLLLANKDEAIEIFALLQTGNLTIDAAALERLLLSMGGGEGDWLQYWLKGENLIWVGRALPAGSVLLRRICAVYTHSIKKKYLLGDPKQETFVARLQAAHIALRDRMPVEAAAALDDWRRLHAQIYQPEAPEAATVAKLEAACQRRAIPAPISLIKRVHTTALSGPEPAGEEELQRMVDSVAGFYGPGVDRAFGVLLELVEPCPIPLRCVYQSYFLRRVDSKARANVVERHRDRLSLPPKTIEDLLAKKWWDWRRWQ